MTTVARLACDEPTARRLASYLAETLDPDDCACGAFEGDDGHWQMATHFGATAGRGPIARAGRDRRRRCGCRRASHRGGGAVRLGGAEPRRPQAGARRTLPGAWRPRQSRREAERSRNRDRGRARLRHRPSRHHAGLPAGARRFGKAAARATNPRHRHRLWRAGDSGGEISAPSCGRRRYRPRRRERGARQCAAQPCRPCDPFRAGRRR